MTGAMLINTASNVACASYYRYNIRVDHVGVSLLFRIPLKLLATLKHSGL